MKILVFLWSLKEEERPLLDTIVRAAFEESEFDLIELQVTPTVSKYSKEDLILCFGPRSFQMVSPLNPGAIKLPLLSQLVDKPSNTETRIEAWEILKRIKDPAIEEESQLELTPEDLLKHLELKSQNVSKDFTEDGTAYWLGTTLTGKKVLISNSNQNLNISCNFKLTLEELYAAKLATELLGLKHLTLVKTGNKNDT